jgi:hypothetical protein
LSIRIDQSLFIVLAHPMPLPGLLLLGNIGSPVSFWITCLSASRLLCRS